jgi:hypothetical protein
MRSLLVLLSCCSLTATAFAEDATAPAPAQTPAPSATAPETTQSATVPETAPAATAPAPAPSASAAAPAAAVAPTGPGAPPAPPAPGAAAAAAVTETPPQPLTEGGKAKEDQHLRQPTPTPGKPRAFGLQAELNAGYDSNVLLDPSQDPKATNTASSVFSGTLKGTWRAINEGRNRLSLIAIAGIDDYPEFSQSQLIRLGGYATGQTHVGRFDPALILGGHRFLLDRKPAATLLTGEARVSQLTPHELMMGSLTTQYLNYDHQHEETGFLIAGGVRYWYMFTANDPRTRLEFAMRVGQYNARRSDQTYGTLEPSARFALHLPGRTWLHSIGEDFSLSGDAEVRYYHAVPAGTTGGPREIRRIYTVQSAFDIWLWRYLAVGPYVAYNTRVSNIPLTGYDRTQVGARLIANW